MTKNRAVETSISQNDRITKRDDARQLDVKEESNDLNAVRCNEEVGKDDEDANATEIDTNGDVVESDDEDVREMTTVTLPSKRKSKKGVVYMSRVPPFMKPEKVRHLLSQYGDVERIYLVEEDKTHRKKRLNAGGNRKVNYTEGWIEFSRKKVAKRVAAALNTRKIGGKKGNFYFDDLWNLKYLKGFQWNHLTEKIAYENRIRDQKLRLEIAQAARENAAFLERVEQSKQIEKMEERKKELPSSTNADREKVRRTFRQHAPADKTKQASLDHPSLLGQVNEDDMIKQRISPGIYASMRCMHHVGFCEEAKMQPAR
jgi:ESF2/ABP1 family protein